MPFILRQFSSIPSLLRSFNHGWMLNFVMKILHSFWNQCSRPPDIFPQLFYTLFHLFIYHSCHLVAQSHLTLWDPVDCSMPGFPVLHHLPELAQTHVYWVSDAILIYCGFFILSISMWPLLIVFISCWNYPPYSCILYSFPIRVFNILIIWLFQISCPKVPTFALYLSLFLLFALSLCSVLFLLAFSSASFCCCCWKLNILCSTVETEINTLSVCKWACLSYWCL